MRVVLAEALPPCEARIWASSRDVITVRAVMVIVAAAFLGVGIPGGQQVGFASLVDLRSGDVTWFHLHARGTGDLRTVEPARETTTSLLEQFPK